MASLVHLSPALPVLTVRLHVSEARRSDFFSLQAVGEKKGGSKRWARFSSSALLKPLFWGRVPVLK